MSVILTIEWSCRPPLRSIVSDMRSTYLRLEGPYVNLSTTKAYLVQQAIAGRWDQIGATPPFQLVGDEGSRHAWLQNRYRRPSQSQLVNRYLDSGQLHPKVRFHTMVRNLVRSR